jgi:hypothetical protein
MQTLTAPDRLSKIRDLNDAFRSTFVGGVVNVTQGIAALPAEVKAEVLRRVRDFSRFTSDNDPHGEHDFGAIDIHGSKFFWKLDYYDRTLEAGSSDPADPRETTRVLTVMLASEY